MDIGKVLSGQSVLTSDRIRNGGPDKQSYDSFVSCVDSKIGNAAINSMKDNFVVEKGYFASFGDRNVVVTEYTSGAVTWHQLSTGFIENDFAVLVTVKLESGDFLYLCFTDDINAILPFSGKSMIDLMNDCPFKVRMSGCNGDASQPYGYLEKICRMSPDSEDVLGVTSALLQTMVYSGKADNLWTTELIDQLRYFSEKRPPLFPDVPSGV